MVASGLVRHQPGLDAYGPSSAGELIEALELSSGDDQLRPWRRATWARKSCASDLRGRVIQTLQWAHQL